eukprot:scaffold1528_cov117-Isochrysis_galbana.AAC.2
MCRNWAASKRLAIRSQWRPDPISSWDPTVPPEPLAPPLGGSGEGERLLVLDLNVEINKSGHANTAIFVPVLAVLGPQPPPLGGGMVDPTFRTQVYTSGRSIPSGQPEAQEPHAGTRGG